ncbi:MAG: ABC transporter ATP-binding protein, partial [Bacteroidia bacterium]
ATSSIDSETEQLIQRAIEALLHNRTAIIIAHRLSTIKHADQILVLDQGRIVERGNHEQLMAHKGSYSQLYATQMTGH